MRARARALLVLACAASAGVLAISACGGRNLEETLDDTITVTHGGGGGATGGGGAGGAGGGHGGGDGGQGGQAPPPPNPIDCVGCIANNCPYTLECIQDPDCVNGLGCAVSSCLSGGQPDLQCFAGCFNGDTGKAYLAYKAITCIFDTCGQECGGGGLPIPGGGGFPGGGGGGKK